MGSDDADYYNPDGVEEQPPAMSMQKKKEIRRYQAEC